MVRVTCPYCGGSFDVPESVSRVTCPYCGTVFEVATKSVVKEHYFYPVVYDSTEAFKRMMSFVSRQYGAPSDVQGGSSLVKRMLHYIPIHLFRLVGIGVCGSQKVYEDEDYTSIVAMLRMPIPVPIEYRFPVRGKRYFEAKVYEYGRYYNPEVDPKTLEDTLRKIMARRVYIESSLSCGSPTVEVDVGYEGLIHYPFWELGYSYGGATYSGIVDAVDGIVVRAEHPMNPQHMRLLKILGSSLIVGGLVVGAGVGAAFHTVLSVAAGGLAGLVGGLIGGIPSLSRGFKPRVVASQLRMGRSPRGSGEVTREVAHLARRLALGW